MPLSLFDLPQREPSSFIGFSGNRLDRQSEKRGDDAVDLALADPKARLMLISSGRLLLKLNGAGFDPHFGVSEIDGWGGDRAGAVLLGVDSVGPVLALASTIDIDSLPDGMKAIDFRSVYAQGLLDSERAGAMAQGISLVTWNATHKFCGRCGSETRAAAGGYKRVCPGCGAEHFPRTDPVAIMLAISGDRCLLGRGKHFGPGMFSALAGFIEPGETIEDAVRRETLEESGIRLGRVAYHASQPWPFPHSLMIGCFGEALNEDIQADLTELEACRWFDREEVFRALEGKHPDGVFLPPRAAIAHHLIRAWAEAG
ncbi:MAG TPA: NAD(+) diphosphatase [Mesorhizobium sp.]